MKYLATLFWPQKDKNGEPYVSEVIKWVNVIVPILLVSFLIFFALAGLKYNWVWAGVWERRTLLIQGWFTTLLIAAITLVTSTLLGLILALLRRVPFLPIRYSIQSFVEIMRASPLIVIILLGWNGIRWPQSSLFEVGILLLTLFEAAYISEIFRSGIESISKSQLEAAQAVGFTRYQTYRYVILPQSIRQVLPPLTGEFVSLTKNSSLLFYIGIPELTQNATEVNSQIYGTLETFLPLALGYLIITIPISLFSRWLEKRFKYET